MSTQPRANSLGRQKAILLVPCLFAFLPPVIFDVMPKILNIGDKHEFETNRR